MFGTRIDEKALTFEHNEMQSMCCLTLLVISFDALFGFFARGLPTLVPSRVITVLVATPVTQTLLEVALLKPHC